MEIKFDTKQTYTVITPVTDMINANLAAVLAQNIDTSTSTGTVNFIIDLRHCNKTDNKSFNELVNLHNTCYAKEQSLVFTGINKDVAVFFKKNDNDQTLNIAPTMQEAIDIISMEKLERDLLKEE